MADGVWDPFAEPTNEESSSVPDTLPGKSAATKMEAAAVGAPLQDEAAMTIEFTDFAVASLHALPAFRVRIAVLMACGSPTLGGGLFMEGALFEAIAKSLHRRAIPYLRFDYAGRGRSAALGTPEYEEIDRDVKEVAKHMLDNYCSELLILGYSGGSVASFRMATIPMFAKKMPALCSVSIGIEVYKFFTDWKDTKTDTEYQRKNFHDLHSESEARVKYFIGSADKMTPEATLRELIAKRPDGGAGAEVHVVDGGDHPMTGKEDEVAELVGDWIAGVLQ